jgi:60 kDa SS-A/Ro ribonucleoprotein
MADPLTKINFLETPQNQPATPDQVLNSAGGYTFKLDDLARLRRFLILGVDGGTFYVSEQKLTADNAALVIDLAKNRTAELVAMTVEVSVSGAAPRQNPALFALAAAASFGDLEGRQAALEFLPMVARTGTHLFIFVNYAKQFRGWGRALRRAVANWYLTRSVPDTAYQVLKYRSRRV